MYIYIYIYPWPWVRLKALTGDNRYLLPKKKNRKIEKNRKKDKRTKGRTGKKQE
jgi:hypothetical protein